jgi:hypothetical protein
VPAVAAAEDRVTNQNDDGLSLMLRNLSINLAIICFLALLFPGCDSDKHSRSNVDVSGTWHAQFAVESCKPAYFCSATGMTLGATGNAVLTLSQSGNKVQGTYTYQTASIKSDVSGTVTGNRVVLDGSVTKEMGRIKVHLTGTVLKNQMQSTATYDVTLADGQSGRITGSGNFSLS